MSYQKKVVIDIKNFLFEKSKISDEVLTVSKIGVDFGLTRQTLQNWNNEAPDVISVLFYIRKQTPKTDILKALIEWQKPPTVLVFIREFMLKYKCDFNDIVKEK